MKQSCTLFDSNSCDYLKIKRIYEKLRDITLGCVHFTQIIMMEL